MYIIPINGTDPSFDGRAAVELFNEEISLAQMVRMRKNFDFTGQICTASEL